VRASQIASTRALGLLAAVSGAFESGDWERLRTLYDDGARITSVAGGDRILSPDELVELLPAVGVEAYSLDEAQTEALDESAVVVWGLVRRRDDVGTSYTQSAWLLTFRDGLVWRSRSYASIDAARAAYREQGLDLGIE
jgi:hypothetical protein